MLSASAFCFQDTLKQYDAFKNTVTFIKTSLPYCTLHVRDFERTWNTLKGIILLLDLVFLWVLATI